MLHRIRERAEHGTPKRDYLIAPLGEALLLVIAGLAGWLSHTPLIFTSLGPTAYEMIETPHRKTAKPYNVILGHAIGIGAGFLALYVTGAWWAPKVSASAVPILRVWAAAIATLLTVFFTLLLDATQPAALSTTLLVSLGTLQQPRDAGLIMTAVLLMVLIGEPLRRWRLQGNAAKMHVEQKRAELNGEA
jgi:uncharacterized membrane protein YedE/YeeE